MKDELTLEYADLIRPHLVLAKRAFGSRAIESPQHDASREYTRLLVEFYAKGGSLLQLSKELDVTYAGMRRRVMTAELPAQPKGKNSKASDEDVKYAMRRIGILKTNSNSTDLYHDLILYFYEERSVSLAKLAKEMGLSSANPLYYAVSKAKLRRGQLL